MNVPAVAIAIGCVAGGVALGISAISQWRSGVTFSNRGGPAGPISREDRPGYFRFLFWARATLGPLAALAGLAGLSHLF